MYFFATICMLRGIYKSMDCTAIVTVILFNVCLLLNAVLSIFDLLDFLGDRVDVEEIKLLKRISFTISYIILFYIELYYSIQLKEIIDKINNVHIDNMRKTKIIYRSLQLTILIFFVTQIIRDFYYDIDPVTPAVTIIALVNVFMRTFSLLPLVVLQLIYLTKFYKLYSEACNF